MWDFGSHNFNINKDAPKGKSKQFYNAYLKDISNDKVFYFRNYIENDTFIFTSFLFKNIFRTLVFYKDEKTYKLFTEFKEKGFLPDGINFFENGIYFCVDASYINEVVPKTLLNDEMRHIIDNVNLEDNPLIVKYYFREAL